MISEMTSGERRLLGPGVSIRAESALDDCALAQGTEPNTRTAASAAVSGPMFQRRWRDDLVLARWSVLMAFLLCSIFSLILQTTEAIAEFLVATLKTQPCSLSDCSNARTRSENTKPHETGNPRRHSLNSPSNETHYETHPHTSHRPLAHGIIRAARR